MSGKSPSLNSVSWLLCSKSATISPQSMAALSTWPRMMNRNAPSSDFEVLPGLSNCLGYAWLHMAMWCVSPFQKQQNTWNCSIQYQRQDASKNKDKVCRSRRSVLYMLHGCLKLQVQPDHTELRVNKNESSLSMIASKVVVLLAFN